MGLGIHNIAAQWCFKETVSVNMTLGALALILLITAALIVLLLGVYLAAQAPQFKDLVGAQVLGPPEPPKPQIRKPVIKQTDQTDNPK